MGLSSRAVATSAVTANGAQLLAGLMVPGDRSLVEVSVAFLGAESHARISVSYERKCCLSLFLFQATVAYMRGELTNGKI